MKINPSFPDFKGMVQTGLEKSENFLCIKTLGNKWESIEIWTEKNIDSVEIIGFCNCTEGILFQETLAPNIITKDG